MCTAADAAGPGPAPTPSTEPDRTRRSALALAGLFIGAVLLRLCLPFSDNDSMTLYDACTWALMHQQNWGKQAVVGLLEYPPLPILALILLSPLTSAASWLLGGAAADWLEPARWLVAIAQVWTCSYVVRTLGLFTRSPARWLAAILLTMLPAAGEFLWELDPFWIYLVPLASVLFHLCRWEREGQLRDAVVIALNCGVLVLGGATGMLFGLTVLLALWSFSRWKRIRQPGLLTLLMMPFVYVMLLYPLFNWLVMGDPFFYLKHFFSFFSILHFQTISADRWVLCLVLFLLVSLICLLPHVPLVLRIAVLLCGGGAVTCLGAAAGRLFLGGDYLFTGFGTVFIVCGILASRPSADRAQVGPGGLTMPVFAVLLAIVCLPAAVTLRRDAKAREPFLTPGNTPALGELLAVVDEHWADSRLLLYDIRAATIYVRQNPQRFVARLDFNASYLRDRMRDEQFHLLLPPNTGDFYARYHGPLTNIHENGAPWLFFERRWPPGWQLWRCLRALQPPTPEAAAEPAPEVGEPALEAGKPPAAAPAAP